MNAATWTQQEVVEAYGDGLKKHGREYAGPCPSCAGDDRFYIRPDGYFGCRQCGEDGSNYEVLARALGLWEDNGVRRIRPPDWDKVRRENEVLADLARAARERVIGTGQGENPDGLAAAATRAAVAAERAVEAGVSDVVDIPPATAGTC